MEGQKVVMEGQKVVMEGQKVATNIETIYSRPYSYYMYKNSVQNTVPQL